MRHWDWLTIGVSIVSVLVVLAVIFAIWLSFQPYCTTFSDQVTVCSQQQSLTHRVFWYEPVHK